MSAYWNPDKFTLLAPSLSFSHSYYVQICLWCGILRSEQSWTTLKRRIAGPQVPLGRMVTGKGYSRSEFKHTEHMIIAGIQKVKKGPSYLHWQFAIVAAQQMVLSILNGTVCFTISYCLRWRIIVITFIVFQISFSFKKLSAAFFAVYSTRVLIIGQPCVRPEPLWRS